MAGSVGTVYYDVLPNLDGFAAKMAAGVATQKPVKIPVEVDAAKASASLKQVSAGTSQLTAQSARLAAAQGKVRVSAAQLNELRSKGTTSAARLVAAEERYAGALRGVQRARDLDTRDAARAAAVRQRASDQAIRAAEKQAQAAKRAADQQVAARRAAVQGLGGGLLKGGAGIAVGLGVATKVTADFDKAVSNVASTGAEARASIGQLREEAIKYGAATSFSAREAADAQAELIKANVSVTDTINGGLAGALNLAEAGSLGVAEAAGIMGTSLSQFELDGTKATHVADLLAAGAGKAQGEVTDFAEALKYVGPVAKSSNVSLEETTGVIAELANKGILGSQAGTSLRGILLALTAPAGAGAKAMRDYGINVRDANGEFIGFGGAAAELRAKLGNLSKAERDAALARIFGRNSITAATVLYEGGAEAVKQWTDAVNDSGYAATVARTKMDNLSGDVEQLRGALDSAFIKTGGGGTAFLRDLAQGATEAIEDFNGLSPAVQEGVFQVGALAAAGALGAGGLIKLTGAGVGALSTLTTLGVIAPTTARGLTAVGTAGLAAGAGLAAVAAGNLALDKLGAQTKPLAELDKNLTAIARGQGDLNSVFAGGNFWDELQGALTSGISPAKDLQSALRGLEVTQDTAAGKFSRLRETITPGTQSIEQAEEQVSALDEALANMVTSGRGDQAAAAVKRLGINGQQSSRFLTQYNEALRGQADAAVSAFRAGERASEGSSAAADGARDIGDAAGYSADELKQMSAELYNAANASLALSGNQIAVESAMDAARDSAKKNGETLDINTEKGRANQSALDSLASATLNTTQAMYEQGKSAGDIAAVNDRAKESWIKSAVAMGKNGDKARELADELFALPSDVTSQVILTGAKVSEKEAKSLTRELQSIPASKRAQIITIAQTKGAKEARTAMAAIRSKEVIAKATGRGVNTVTEIDKALKKLKSKGVRADAKAAGKGAVDALDAAIRKLKDKRVRASAETSGEGAVNNLRNALGGLKSKTVYATVIERKMKADGGTLDYPGHYGGGTIRGYGGPREDNIAAIDRATGKQIAWVSATEEVVNARQSALNRMQIKRINAGGLWDVVPRHAGGGTIARASSGTGTASAGTAVSSRPRTLMLMLDMGPIFGGIQQLVLDLQDDRDEYAATVGRMR